MGRGASQAKPTFNRRQKICDFRSLRADGAALGWRKVLVHGGAMWEPIFELTATRSYGDVIFGVVINAMFIAATVWFYFKENDWRKALAFLLTIVILDVGAWITTVDSKIKFFRARYDPQAIAVEGRVDRCRLGDRGRRGAATIIINGTEYWLDNFIDWRPCEWVRAGSNARLKFSRVDDRNIVLKLDLRRN